MSSNRDYRGRCPRLMSWTPLSGQPTGLRKSRSSAQHRDDEGCGLMGISAARISHVHVPLPSASPPDGGLKHHRRNLAVPLRGHPYATGPCATPREDSLAVNGSTHTVSPARASRSRGSGIAPCRRNAAGANINECIRLTRGNGADHPVAPGWPSAPAAGNAARRCRWVRWAMLR